jgi:hypothetical protein
MPRLTITLSPDAPAGTEVRVPEPPVAPPVTPAPPSPAPQGVEQPVADSGGSRGDLQRWLGIGAGGLGVVPIVATSSTSAW